MTFINDIVFLLPELFLFISIFVLLIFSIIRKTEIIDSSKNSYDLRTNVSLEMSVISVLVVVISFFIILFSPITDFSIFGFSVVSDILVRNIKILIIFFTILVLFTFYNYLLVELNSGYELPFLVIIASTAMMFIVESNDMLFFYVSLELQSLVFYVLASSKQYSNISTEAGLKYFIMGSLASAFILFGMSIIYGYSGLTNFTEISMLFFDGSQNFGGLLIGFLFFLIGILFKFPAAPFHSWAPDVYDGSPTIITLFFSLVPKLTIGAFILRFLYIIFPFFVEYWSFISYMCGFISLIIGSFAALYQTRIKRFLAYSTISHVGFIMMAISTGTLEGFQATIFYLVVYLIMSLNFFSILLGVRYGYGIKMSKLTDLFAIYRSYPIVSVILSINLFSMAGVPPLAGFFSKFYVLVSLVKSDMYFGAIFCVLISVMSCFYYIRIIRNMFFTDRFIWNTLYNIPTEISYIIAFTAIFNVLAFPIFNWLLLPIENISLSLL